MIRGSIHKVAWCLTVLAIVLGVTGVACAQLAQQILLFPTQNQGKW